MLPHYREVSVVAAVQEPLDPTVQAGPPGDSPSPRRSGWTSGRVACAVAGALLAALSLGLLGAGGAATWATTAGRHAGYVSLRTQTFRTSGYAVASSPVKLHAYTPGWDAFRALLGTVRLTATSAGPRVFVGIAPADRAASYLSGTPYVTVRDITSSDHVRYTVHRGAAAPVRPDRASIWTVRATGPGTQALTWQPRTGNWTVVAMNADASRPVSVRVAVAATVPALPWVAGALLTAGVVALILALTLIIVPARRATAPAAPVPLARSGDGVQE